MEAGLATLQHGATVLLYVAAAVGIGASMSSLWIGRGGSVWAAARLPALHRCTLGACVLALLASVAVLCLEAATMAEVPLAEAAPAVRLMLVSTHYGAAWGVGTAALAFASALLLLVPRHFVRGWAIGTTAALAVFWFARSMVSHAAGDGDLSMAVVANWLHLGLISLWVGEVLVAGLVVLPGASPETGAARRDRAAYVKALSNSATLALAGVAATGLFSTWQRIDGVNGLFASPYGRTLLAKLAVVGLAVLLGGFNRFFVMPGWLAAETAGRTAAPLLARRFKLVLKVEGLVLFAALVLAVLLASTAPGGDGT